MRRRHLARGRVDRGPGTLDVVVEILHDMNRLALILAATMACFSPFARADGSGSYIGAGVNDSWHLHLVAGHDFNRIAGIELGWQDFGSSDVYSPPSLGNNASVIGSESNSALTLAAKIGYKFHSGWSVFGKVGIAQVWTAYSPGSGWTLTIPNHEKSPGMVTGLNTQYDFDDTVGIRLCAEAVVFGGNSATYSGAGVSIFSTTSLLAIFHL